MAGLPLTTDIALYNAAYVMTPALTMDARHQSDDAFRSSRAKPTVAMMSSHTEVQSEAVSTELNVTEARERSYARALTTEQRAGSQSLLRMSIILLVAGVVFMLHSRIATRNQAGTDS